ncbi:unnamed protein product [Knipowitschia caucasica]
MHCDRSLEEVSALKSVGYPGAACLARCVCDELPCPLLTWLCAQLEVHYPQLKGGGGNLLLADELKTLLLEMSSPLASLTLEVLDPSKLDRITDFLVSELQAAIIIKHKDCPSDDEAPTETSPKEQRCRSSINPEENCEDDCEEAVVNKHAEWLSMLQTLSMDANSSITDILNEVETRISNLPSDAMSPLLNTPLSPEHWVKLEKLNDILSEDYKCRRQMMIKRFQVTLESFSWGDNKTNQKKVLENLPQISSFDHPSKVSLPLVLAARVNQSCNDPIRPGNSTPVYKVKMGAVPDRGGRPGEMEPPMPTWQDQRSGHRSGQASGNQKWRKFSDKKKHKH